MHTKFQLNPIKSIPSPCFIPLKDIYSSMDGKIHTKIKHDIFTGLLIYYDLQLCILTSIVLYKTIYLALGWVI